MENIFVDTHPKSSANLEDIQLEWLTDEDADPSQMLSDRQDLNGEIDDESIVRRFALGKRREIANQSLRIDYAHNSLQLSTPDRDLIAIHKASNRFQYILVKKDGEYSEFIHNLILEHQFIPIDPSSANRGFIRYQKYEIPAEYKLQYAPASELWHTWKDHRQDLNLGWRLDILVLAKSKWYRVQAMSLATDKVELVTRVGTIATKLGDRIAWIEKLEMVETETLERTRAVVKQQLNNPSDSDILAKIMSRLAIESEPNEPESDLTNGATISQVTDAELSSATKMFSAVDRTSNLMAESESQSKNPIAANYLDRDGTISTVDQERLMDMATRVLENYLERGETIVRTEVISDAEGNVISEKVVTIKRGCPRWAIDTVLNW
jgi:hypothetical protein